MGSPDGFPEAVGRKITLASTPLAAGGGCVLVMPGDEGLHRAAQKQNLRVVGFALTGVAVFCVVECDIVRVG